MKKRFTHEQVIAIPRGAEVGSVPIKALCRKHNISEQTFSAGAIVSVIDVPDARRLAGPLHKADVRPGNPAAFTVVFSQALKPVLKKGGVTRAT